jgi:hypothetical protein
MYSLYLHHSHFWFYSQNTGGHIIEETSQILKEAQHCAQQELAAQTGDTNSRMGWAFTTKSLSIRSQTSTKTNSCIKMMLRMRMVM